MPFGIILQRARSRERVVSCRAAVRKIIISRDISRKGEKREKIAAARSDLSLSLSLFPLLHPLPPSAAAPRDYFAWRARYQLRARNVAGIRIHWFPSCFLLAVGPRVTTSQPLLAGLRNEKRQHPTGNCIDAPCTGKSISSLQFSRKKRVIRESGRACFRAQVLR